MLTRKRTDPPHLRLRYASSAFTMIELLVVMGVLTLLVSILLPSLSAARHQAQSVACRSNIRELIIANGYYRDDHEGRYVPGATDIYGENLHRWHGLRDNPTEAFDSSRGLLAPYLGPGGAIRRCPTFAAEEIVAENAEFEEGNGGYGYNNSYIGVRVPRAPGDTRDVTDELSGALASRIRRPAETIMFTDSAFAGQTLIEYSFAEPRFHLWNPAYRTDPSIHFRHAGLTNVGWCDGHVDTHMMTFTHHSGIYRSDPKSFDIGWFGRADDNSLFDLD